MYTVLCYEGLHIYEWVHRRHLARWLLGRLIEIWKALLHGLINYIGTKAKKVLIEGNAKCCHLKKLTCKGTLWQVFIRVYRLEIQSVKLVFSTQLCELVELSPFPPVSVWISILCLLWVLSFYALLWHYTSKRFLMVRSGIIVCRMVVKVWPFEERGSMETTAMLNKISVGRYVRHDGSSII